MPKTVDAGNIRIGGERFELRVKPDVFDRRDQEYRPKLQMLPPEVQPLPGAVILTQQGNSCTGHAVAAAINTARRAALHAERVPFGDDLQASPYMLYALARRYDEFPGNDDAGSSLRGVLKGWFHHGLVSTRQWPKLDTDMPDLGDESFRQQAAVFPLGAFYRVNPYRLDDMQSAITELNAVVVSAVIHEGWRKPQPVRRGNQTLHIIARPDNGGALGGHAFALVGYNSVGFIVQNSWGAAWGDGGFATLPYEDWLESAYDAWVARTGVQADKLYISGWEGGQRGTGGRLLLAPGPETARLTRYVVNLGNNGRLSDAGRFTSSPTQLDQILSNMRDFHQGQQEAHVVLYAHGGLVSESEGLINAQKHLNWWLKNGVYPINLAWQTGVGETLYSQLVDLFGNRLPAGLSFDFFEQVDRLVEGLSSGLIRWMWEQMKQNALAAGLPPKAGDEIRGGTLLLRKLASSAKDGIYQSKPLHLHLVGHSAGSILLSGLLARLQVEGLKAESVQFLAPALNYSQFIELVLPHLKGSNASRQIKRFAIFNLTDQDELDDVCGFGGVNPYHKSLLYLISRALEVPGQETPLLGMSKFHTQPLLPKGQSLASFLQDTGGVLITPDSSNQADSLTGARNHGSFDDDKLTMTAVLLRILNQTSAAGHEYTPNAALRPASPSSARPPKPTPGGPPIAAAAPLGSGLGARARIKAGERPALPPDPPVLQAPAVDDVAAPETGCVILDRLSRDGWEVASM